MADENKKEIKLDSPRKPLEPVGECVSDEQSAAYAKLLTEYERIEEIRDKQVEGASLNFDKEKKSYTVDEYNDFVATYKVARAEYNKRFADSIETIEMIREKLRKMIEEDEKFDKEHPEVDLPEVPEMEDRPDEPWEELTKRFEELDKRFQEWNEQFAKNAVSMSYHSKRLKERLEEMGKFPQLEYELEMRLRHTYIDQKTGEQFYRPDDEVGEGLVCLGSRDYTPVLKDE